MMNLTVDEYTHFYMVGIRVDKDKGLTEFDALELAAKELGREIVRRQAAYNKHLFGGAS